MKSLFKFATVISLSFFLLGCLGSKITQENYDKIQNGMTMEQVVAILGEPTSNDSVDLGGLISGKTAKWQADNGTTISVQFFQGAVKFKTFTEGNK
jgi:hypothetical protein